MSIAATLRFRRWCNWTTATSSAASGDVNGNIDIDFLGSLELCAQQIKVQVRMAFADGRVVVIPAMVADAEAGNRIHVAAFQGILELPLVECRADCRDVGRGMKVQMDLTKSKLLHEIILLELRSRRQ